MQHVAETQALARQALKEMRLLVYELQPPALEAEGLIGALRSRLSAVETRAGLDTSISVDGDPAVLPAPVERAFYGFAQEALNNVLKHARARRVDVRAVFVPDHATIEVYDDGEGFLPDVATECGGLGLESMRERIERVGGTMWCESTPGCGARVTADVQLSQAGGDT